MAEINQYIPRGQLEIRNNRKMLKSQNLFYDLTKYGNATNPAPTATSMYIFEIKYGNINRAIPTKSGTTALCFLPYIK